MSISPETVFNSHYLSMLTEHPHLAEHIPDSTQVFDLVDNVLSLQKFDGTRDSHMNDYNKILDLYISQMNSIFEASKTFETFFVTLKDQIKQYVHQIVSSYIESHTYMTGVSDVSSSDQSKSLDQVFLKIRFFLDLILGMREGCDNFIVASEHAFFVKNNFLYTFIPEKFSREKQLPSNHMICGVGSTIYVVSNSNNSLYQIETSSINAEETFSLKELLGNDIPVICIGEKNGNLALIQKINGKIFQNILTLDQQNKNVQTELYESTMNDSKFYFRDGKLYEVGDKTYIDGILSEEKPIYPIYAEKASSFYIEDGKILYQKYPGEDKSEINDILLVLIKPFPTMKEKLINPLLHDKKVNYLQFTQNITSTSRLILYIMERINVLPQEHRIGVVAGLMTILTINLHHYAFQTIEQSTIANIYSIYKQFLPYSSSLSISILQWMAVIPTTIYSDTFIVNKILRPAFSHIYNNPEYSSVRDFIIKKPQSLFLVSEELISQLSDQDGIILIIRTIDYLPICYEAMNAVESCAEYVSIVLKTISKMIENDMLHNANRYLQHLIYSLSTLSTSHQIAEVFIKDSLHILIKLSKRIENNEISDMCDKNFTGLERVYIKHKEFFKVYELDCSQSFTITADNIRNFKLTFQLNTVSSPTIKINGSEFSVQNGLVVTVFSPTININYKCYSHEVVLMTVEGSKFEAQPEDKLEPNLTLINYVAKTIGSFIDQLLESTSISRLEYDARHLIGNSFIREFDSFSENPEIVNYFEKKDENTVKFLDFMDKLSGINIKIKKMVKNFEELLEKVLTVYIYQLNSKDEVEKLINEQNLTKDKVSHKLRLIWTSVSGLRRELLSLKQKETAGTSISKYSLQDFIQNITEKCQYLTSSKLPLDLSDEDIVKYLNDLFINYIPVQDIIKISNEQNKRLYLRKIALEAVSDFMTNSKLLKLSTVETFLINIKVSFSIINDEKSSLIGKNSLYKSLLESLEMCINSFYSAMIEIKSDCVFISFMKFFCKCTTIVQKFTEGIIYILTNSSKKFLKYAEPILVSLSNEPIVIETINNGALEIDDEDYRAMAFFILSLSENAKVPYEILFSKKNSQRCEVASLLLAGKLLVKDKEGESYLRENLDSLVEELSQTMLGEDNRFSVCAEIISFFRFLMLPFSVHKDFILEYLHSLFVTKTMIFTNKIIAAFLILGHPLFRAEDTGIVYNSNMIRILYNNVDKEQIENVYPMVRIPIDPNTFTLTQSEVSVIVGLQEKINGIVSQNKNISLHKANDIAIFYLFLATALQNPQNAEQFKPHAAKLLKFSDMKAITRKGISPPKLMNRLAENLYRLSLFPEISGDERKGKEPFYRFINMTTGIVYMDRLDSAAVGISLFVGEVKVKKNQSFGFRIHFEKPGEASIGFIDANSFPSKIKFYGLTSWFMQYSNVTASITPNSICVSDTDGGYLGDFLTGDMLPAIITKNCRIKMVYQFYTINPKDNSEFPLFDAEMPPRVSENMLACYNDEETTFDLKVIGEKVRTKNGIIGEIDSILKGNGGDQKLILKISNRDGSCEKATIQAKYVEVIPERIHTLITRAKRKSREDKIQEITNRNILLKKHNRMVGKLMLLCMRSIVPLISSSYSLSTIKTIMDYALPFTFGASNPTPTKVSTFTSPYITNINYRFPGDRQYLIDFVRKELPKFDMQDIINYIVEKLTVDTITSSNCVYNLLFARSKNVTLNITLNEDEAVIFPIEFNSKRNIGATIPNGTYSFVDCKHIGFIRVPKFLPETDINSAIVILHLISTFIDSAEDKITYDEIHKLSTSILKQLPNNSTIINSMRLFIQKNVELACRNKKYISSVLEEIRTISSSELSIISYLANLKEKLISSLDIESDDFEYYARQIVSVESPTDERINEFLLLKAIHKNSSPSDKFNIFALSYIVEGKMSLKQMYKIAMDSYQSFDSDVDSTLYRSISKEIHYDALLEIRRKMIIRFMDVPTEKYKEYFDFSYFFNDSSYEFDLKELPKRYQIIVSFNRFSAFKFFEGGDSGKSLLSQFAQQYTDYSCLGVVGSHPWKVNLYGEHAIDAGGPGKELFTQCCEEILNPKMKLLCLTPNAKANYEEEYLPCISNNLGACAGAFIAACATTKMPFPFKICAPFWKSLTGKPTTVDDVFLIYNEFAMLMFKLKHLNFDSNEEFMNNYKLNFTIQDLYGNQMEIIPNGRQIKVDLNNLQMFIYSAEKKLTKQLKQAFKTFKDGFYKVLDKRVCTSVYSFALKNACCGAETLSDQDFLNFFTFSAKSWLLEQCLVKLTQEERFSLLKFATGARIPKTKISVHLDRSKNSGLPTATTCISSMSVPMYKSFDVCLRSIRAAIQFSAGITDSDFDYRMFN